MDVRKLEAFCKVYEFSSFSKAGEAMFLSQPTISSHVANLEEELDVRLFDRMGRNVLPTQAGHVLYRSATSVFNNLNDAKAAIAMLRDKVVGELTIGCSTIPSHNILPMILKEFSQQYPAVSFNVQTCNSSSVIDKLSAGEWPVGVVGQLPSADGIHSELLCSDDIVVVASPEASWLPELGKTLNMDEVMTLPWIMRSKGSATRLVLEEVLARFGKRISDVNMRCVVDGTCEALAHALYGVGLNVTSRLAAKSFLESGELITLDVPELSGKRSFYLIYHADRYMFPALEKFVTYATTNFSID